MLLLRCQLVEPSIACEKFVAELACENASHSHLFRDLANEVEGDGDANEGRVAALDSLYDVLKRVDRKSTRLNSSHITISYAVFCLKKKTKKRKNKKKK